MWGWFTANGLWILICSIIAFIGFFIIIHRIQDRIVKVAPGAKKEKLDKRIKLITRVFTGISITLIIVAAVAIVTSRQGVLRIITPETIQRWLLEHGIYVLAIISIAYLLYRLAIVTTPKVVGRLIDSGKKGRKAREELAKRADTLGRVLSGFIAIVIALIALFMILSELGIDITPLLASAGVLGIAVGFGAQSIVKDLLRGFIILVQNQYNKGDVVRVAGIAGLVEDVNMLRTVLRDLDGIVHSIPNSEITTSSNFTKEWSRVNLDVSVAYGEDLDRVAEVINRIGNELSEDEYYGPKIITAPQVLRVNNFGDSGIDIKILGDTKPLTQWEVTGELRKRIKKAFDEEGIEIPWPHVKLYFGQDQTNEYLICKACSHVNFQGSKFCSKCGASLQK